jgi:hypothetical protein
METLTYRITYNKDIVNDLVFYIELSLYLCANGSPTTESCYSLQQYLSDLKKHYAQFNDPEILMLYLQKSYTKIPASFFNLIGIDPLLNERIFTIDVNFSWVPKL